VFLFALSSLLHHQRRWGLPYNSHDYVLDAVSAIALSFGFVGGHELDRLGYPRVGSALACCIIPISIALFFVLIVWGGFSEHWFNAAIALFAAPFPVALYLNRNQSKSTSQPAIDHAN
jgi:hypothetical protein